MNPPYDETISRRNSFGCNLPPALERSKILSLVRAIEDGLGLTPGVYKAGRYGLGPSTIEILQDLEFEIDVSINPHMDFTAGEGPSFKGFDAAPFWFGRRQRLLEIPCTGGYVGFAWRSGAWLRPLVEAQPFQALRLPGVLARTGILDRVLLSPEGNSLQDMKALTMSLLARGIRVFAMTLHSPSAEPGHTPYVRSQRQLQDLLERMEGYCEFFLGDIGGVAGTLEDVRASLAGVTRT